MEIVLKWVHPRGVLLWVTYVYTMRKNILGNYLKKDGIANRMIETTYIMEKNKIYCTHQMSYS